MKESKELEEERNTIIGRTLNLLRMFTGNVGFSRYAKAEKHNDS